MGPRMVSIISAYTKSFSWLESFSFKGIWRKYWERMSCVSILQGLGAVEPDDGRLFLPQFRGGLLLGGQDSPRRTCYSESIRLPLLGIP